MIDGHGGGVALQCLGCHADALAVFSSGLSQDPKSLQLLAGLVEAAVKSPLRGKVASLGVGVKGNGWGGVCCSVQCLGHHTTILAVFSSGTSQNLKSLQLLTKLVA